MKKFVYRVLLTAVAVALCAIVLDCVITKNLHRSEARLFQSWNDIFYDSTDYDVLVMGSSRGQVQYDPRIIDSVLMCNSYNLGIDGRCIDAEIVRYYAYRQYHHKPKLIVQNVDYGTMSLSNGYEREQFLPYLYIDTLFAMTRKSEDFSIWDKCLPLIRYAGYPEVIKEGLGLPNKLNMYKIYKGYCCHDYEWDGGVFAEIDSLGYCANPKAVSMFDQYLSRCKADGVKVVLVFAPIYIGVSEKTIDAEGAFALYQSFADKYGLTVLNYTFDSISYDTNYFYNASHLNKNGAEAFSRILAQDLSRLYD